jgi:acyl-CoA thioester hydrolase
MGVSHDDAFLFLVVGLETLQALSALQAGTVLTSINASRWPSRGTAAIDAGALQGHVTGRLFSFQGSQVQTAHLDGAIKDGRHHMQVRVYYEDTDFSGIVYHANYLRFMERGRSNYLRLLGADQRALFAEAESEAPGFNFVVRSMQLEFLKPARMDDLLDIVTWPLEVKGASIMLGQEVRRGDLLLLEAKVKVAFVSGGQAKPIPKALRMAMKADHI